ncbi:hypothetical protein BGX28_005492 [Mortierella sp. GBA30]|nr:hypothetical protein BGX28_005492 [Mortierella sp. GBA30]
MPMQVFEFQADTSVSLVSPAAINRKSCDHCFLNRKTCDKVRQAADSGEKCKRCAKDNRPCTFTPTVHLYHIADCVGRHQCRAKVIQAMGGRKKEVQFKTIEIPIICDMDSVADQALFDFIQKQPNLLVYNNRIKSFLAQDMLGLSADHDDASSMVSQFSQGVSSYSTSPSSSNASQRSFSNELASFAPSINTSLSQGSQRYRVVSPVEHQQQMPYQHAQRPHPYANHQRSSSDERGRQGHHHRPSHSPRSGIQGTSQSYQAHAYGSLSNGDTVSGLTSTAGRLSPVSSSTTPIEGTADYEQKRHSDNMTSVALAAASTGMDGPAGGIYRHQMQPMQQPMQQHPYAQQSPYPQAPFFHQPQPQLPQEVQQPSLDSYRNPSPFPSSPIAPSPIQSTCSPHPPSPLEFSLGVNANFGSMGNSSHHNLTSLFDTTLTMGNQVQAQQPQQFHRRNLSTSSSYSASSASPLMPMSSEMSTTGTPSSVTAPIPNPPPMVITTTNEEGHEVGFYYAVPAVNLNPNFTDSDLFHDFTMMDALGEDFVWVENLFGETTCDASVGDEISAPAHVAAQGGDAVTVAATFGASLNSAIPAAAGAMETDQWTSQYNPYGSSDESAGRISHTLLG